MLIAVFCLFAFPRFDARYPQFKTFVLRRRYRLYCALQSAPVARSSCLRRVHDVQRLGFQVHEVTALLLAPDAPPGRVAGGAVRAYIRGNHD